MDSNQKKIRNLLLYIGIPVVVLFIIIFLFSNRAPQGMTYKYSDIIDYFQSQKVTEYQLNLGTGEMAIKLDDGKTIGYVLPSVDLFYMDVKDSILTAKWCRTSSVRRRLAGLSACCPR